MYRKTMNLPWLREFFGLLIVVTAVGAGFYQYARYEAQPTQIVHQQAQALSKLFQDETPTDCSASTNLGANTEGKERDSTWSSTGDIIFAFGDSGRYFLSYRSEPNGTNCQLQTMAARYSIMATGLQERMIRPYFYAWTSTEDELLGYMDSITEKPTWQFRMDPHRPVSAPTYTSLLHWLNKNVNTEEEILQTKVVFGSKSTYFAQNGKTCTYHDLPPLLHNQILEKKYAMADPAADPKSWIPRIVALGPENTFVALWHNGDQIVSLSGTSSLTTELKNKDDNGALSNKYESIVLSPFNVADFFRVTKTGQVKWSMACSDDVHLALMTHVGAYSQVRAKEDRTTFNLSNTVQGVTREVEISPDTNYDVANIQAALKVSGTVAMVESSMLDKVKALIR